jgi:2-polyprenyl-3-methyl-5-hydroxy-6-metoxy-1,4-benzoquinol methylase
MAPTYDPTVFNVASEADAKAIILTPEAGRTPHERWDVETPDVISRILPWLSVSEPSRIVDWGCGIGRLAKPLCELGHEVLGVDLSADMRRLAERYVNNPRFFVGPPQVYEDAWLRGDALRQSYDAGIASWVLQHIPRVERACAALRHILSDGAPLFVLNRVERVIPVVGGWTTDGKDVWAALRGAGFVLETEQQLSLPLYEPGSVWAVWRAA